MILLALECSSPRRSVAVARDGQVLAEASHAGGRSTPLFAMIGDTLQRAGIGRDAIDAVVVGLGPGSYTGIRGAIAVAQGFELARNVRLLGAGSADACAWRAWKRGLRGRIAVVIDAQRGEFHLAEFDLSPAADSNSSPFTQVLPLRIASRDEVERARIAGATLVGPELEALGLVGETAGSDAPSLVAVAAGRTDFVPGERLEPIYIRPTAFVKAPAPRVLP